MAGQVDEEAFESVEHDASLSVVGLELVAHLGVEVVEDFLAGAFHLPVDLRTVAGLELVKGFLDLLCGGAPFEDCGNVFLEVQAVFDLAEDFVRGPEHGGEEFELFGQQLQDAFFCDVAFVGKVHHDHVVFLPETVDAADALFHALGIPWKVVVDQHGTELQVDAFSGGFGRDHEPATLAELIDQGFAPVSGRDTSDQVTALVFFEPGLIDLVRVGTVVRAVKQDNAFTPSSLRKAAGEVVLSDGGVGEDNGFFRRADLT